MVLILTFVPPLPYILMSFTSIKLHTYIYFYRLRQDNVFFTSFKAKKLVHIENNIDYIVSSYLVAQFNLLD